MSQCLLHIWGPISIQWFGLIITVGLLLFTWLVNRHPYRKKLITDEQFSGALLVGILSGIIGGRLLYVLQEYRFMTSFWEAFRFWEGGFSILGTITIVPIALAIYLKKNKIPILPFFDLIAIYGPLLQSISRLGCFVAGCCYGLPTSLPWAITYTNSHTAAPCHIPLHPTQLYSALFLLCIFLFMRYVAIKFCTKQGQLISLYIVLASTERFILGFLRADREYLKGPILKIISFNQWAALILGSTATIAFIFFTLRSKKINNESI